MATNFPGSLDSFTNPTSGSTLDSPSHAGQHANINDAVEALEAKVGVDGSGVTTSLDYKVANQGLTLVKSQTIGSGVSSVTVTGAFSSTFENYRVILSGGSSAGGASLSLQLSGVTTGYYGGTFGTNYSTGTVSGLGVNNQASWLYAGYKVSTGHCTLVCDIISPFTATRTQIIAGWHFGSVSGAYSAFAGEVTDTSSRTGFVVAPSSGTLTGGTIRVYGYNNG